MNNNYPFGMLMPERQWNSGKYRYGFNAKENDNEIKGIGNQQDYGMRIYDPRLGKFLSVDPIAKEYPWYSPYHFAGNSPVAFVDLDGAEPQWFIDLLKMFGYDLSINQPHSDDRQKEAEYQNEMLHRRNAFVKVSEGIQNTYEAQKTVFSVAPGMGAIYAALEGKYGEAGANIAVDIFGGSAAKAGFGLAMPVLKSTMKSLRGAGGDILKGIIGKVENISTHLTDKDITGAVGDILGAPTKIGDKVFNHLKEVNDALRGLGKQIEHLNKAIDTGTMTDDVLTEAKRVRSSLQKEKDRIQNILNKAEKAASDGQ